MTEVETTRPPFRRLWTRMTRYIVYRWPRDRTSEVTPTDGAFRWVAAEAEVISRLFGDDPGRRNAQLRMLQDGYFGLLCVADGGWCAYAWMRRPNRPGPPHLPRNARRPAAYWITYCRTRPSFRKRGLFQAALRQLVAVAAAENEEADVYVDADANNEMSHRGIVASGFAAVGVIDALSAAVPKVGRIVVGQPASGCDARRTRERPRAIGSVGRGDERRREQICRVGVRLIGPLLTGRFGRGVLVLSGGTAASQALIVLASPLLTRAYTPADFGVYGAALSLITTS